MENEPNERTTCLALTQTTLFDKSVLQSLTIAFINHAALFVEVLADLEKEVQKGLTPEQVDGNLADKSPTGGGVNVHHHRLSVAELFGNKVEMRHFPVIEGGRSVRTRDGKRGVVFGENQQPSRMSCVQGDATISAEIDQITNAPSANRDYSNDEIEAMVIQRSIPVQRGKWRMVPPEAEK